MAPDGGNCLHLVEQRHLELTGRLSEVNLELGRVRVGTLKEVGCGGWLVDLRCVSASLGANFNPSEESSNKRSSMPHAAATLPTRVEITRPGHPFFICQHPLLRLTQPRLLHTKAPKIKNQSTFSTTDTRKVRGVPMCQWVQNWAEKRVCGRSRRLAMLFVVLKSIGKDFLSARLHPLHLVIFSLQPTYKQFAF